MRASGLVLSAALVAGTTPPVAAADHGRLGVRLLDAPTDRRDDPRARVYIVDHLNPGTTIHRRIEVTSTAATSRVVGLYAGAAALDHDAFVFTPEGTTNELTSWISIDRPRLDLGPHGSAVVHVTIAVPKHASRGERYAVIWAQGGPRSGPGNVRMVERVGVRVYLDTGPGGDPPSNFRVERLAPGRDGSSRPYLSAQVRNTGARALDMTGTLSLANGPSGLRAGPDPAPTGVTIPPGQAAPVTVTLPARIPEGPWTATLNLAAGPVRHTVTATITFPVSGIGKATLTGGTTPLALLALAVIAVLVAVAFAIRAYSTTNR